MVSFKSLPPQCHRYLKSITWHKRFRLNLQCHNGGVVICISKKFILEAPKCRHSLLAMMPGALPAPPGAGARPPLPCTQPSQPPCWPQLSLAAPSPVSLRPPLPAGSRAGACREAAGFPEDQPLPRSSAPLVTRGHCRRTLWTQHGTLMSQGGGLQDSLCVRDIAGQTLIDQGPGGSLPVPAPQWYFSLLSGRQTVMFSPLSPAMSADRGPIAASPIPGPKQLNIWLEGPSWKCETGPRL